MKRYCPSLVRFGVAVFLLAFANIINAGDDADGPTRQQFSEMLAELRKISAALEKQIGVGSPGPRKVATEHGINLNLSGIPMLGNIDAPVTIVEFTDYECSFCRSFQETVFQAIKDQYIDSGKVRFYVRNFPLTIHPNAFRAAEAVMCARDQGRFWEMHDTLVANDDLEKEVLRLSKKLSLDSSRFNQCLSNSYHRAAVDSDIAAANEVGIRATPSFVIGTSSNESVSGELIVGAQPFTTFKEALDKLFK